MSTWYSSIVFGSRAEAALQCASLVSSHNNKKLKYTFIYQCHMAAARSIYTAGQLSLSLYPLILKKGFFFFPLF
jgi:hypothetical protein